MHGHRRCILCGPAPHSRADADAEQDWKNITAMDAGPETEPKTRDKALKLTLAQLAAQQALIDFIKAYPDNPHGIEARLRHCPVFSIRSDLENNPSFTPGRLKSSTTFWHPHASTPEKVGCHLCHRITLFAHRAQG